MTFVVTDNCINCKYTDCVATCPVDAFHEGDNFIVINPDVCIDCNACTSECPAEAIFADSELPDELSKFLTLNEEMSHKWPVINIERQPLVDAEEWIKKTNKYQYIIY